MKNKFALALMALFLFPLVLRAQEQVEDTPATEEVRYGPLQLWGVGIKAGTDGVGFELVKGFGTRLNIRIGYQALNIPISYPVPADMLPDMGDFSILAEADLQFGGTNLFVDFYPVKNVIHLTGGVMMNAMQHTVSIRSTSEFPYGDIMVPAEDIGVFSLQLTPGNKFSPYLGLGFGNTLSRKHRISFNFELGALYYGSPQVTLSGDGIIGPIASEHNQSVLSEALAPYPWYPMINFQLTFRLL